MDLKQKISEEINRLIQAVIPGANIIINFCHSSLPTKKLSSCFVVPVDVALMIYSFQFCFELVSFGFSISDFSAAIISYIIYLFIRFLIPNCTKSNNVSLILYINEIRLETCVPFTLMKRHS